MEKVKLGISACLLGLQVRYDGGHKLDPFLRDTLGEHVDYVPVCPEVECGLGVPREAMRLEGDPARPRLVTVRTKQDLTDRMEAWARGRATELGNEGLSGFIFKSKSPSSGMERVKVYGKGGMPAKVGVGIFARIFMERFPLLPVEEEGRLHDPLLRESFIERIFVLKRWRETVEPSRGIAQLVRFHTVHKLLLMAHSPADQKTLGALVAAAKGRPPHEARAEYVALLMRTLAKKATRAKHVNVLQHVMGYFKRDIATDEKQELLELIGEYRAGHLPLVVPLTLLKHYVRKLDEPYLRDQVYLAPHPAELGLRNHV